jgi:hypothetical protein
MRTVPARSRDCRSASRIQGRTWRQPAARCHTGRTRPRTGAALQTELGGRWVRVLAPGTVHPERLPISGSCPGGQDHRHGAFPRPGPGAPPRAAGAPPRPDAPEPAGAALPETAPSRLAARVGAVTRTPRGGPRRPGSMVAGRGPAHARGLAGLAAYVVGIVETLRPDLRQPGARRAPSDSPVPGRRSPRGTATAADQPVDARPSRRRPRWDRA